MCPVQFFCSSQLTEGELRYLVKPRPIMKVILPILVLVLVISSCEKDDVPPVAEPTCLFTTTSTSFSELDLSQTNNDDLFIMNLDVNDDANGMRIDLNCDGADDLLIATSVVDQSNLGTNLLSKVSIQTLNSNTFLLRDSTVLYRFFSESIDTNNFDITHYELTSSFQPNGSVLLDETTNLYPINVDSNSVLTSNDPRWTYQSSAQIIRSRRIATSTNDWGPDSNGYTHYLTNALDYRYGIVPDQAISWIPIRFVTDQGNVKMGFIKLKPELYEGAAEVGVDCWAIQR